MQRVLDVRLALYQPDIPQNAGAMLRLAACMGIAVDIIEPCGFLLDDRRLQRAGMDYLDHVSVTRHTSWDRFVSARRKAAGRLVLLTTRATTRYTDFAFAPDDTILVGRESAGVPDHVHDTADARLLIPMVDGVRSLNVALSAAMAVGEALRQSGPAPRKQLM